MNLPKTSSTDKELFFALFEEEIRNADYFNEKINLLEKIVLSNQRLLNDLQNKWEEFINSIESDKSKSS